MILELERIWTTSSKGNNMLRLLLIVRRFVYEILTLEVLGCILRIELPKLNVSNTEVTNITTVLRYKMYLQRSYFSLL